MTDPTLTVAAIDHAARHACTPKELDALAALINHNLANDHERAKSLGISSRAYLYRLASARRKILDHLDRKRTA